MPADLGQGLNSVSGNTSSNLILDVGQAYEGVDLASLRAAGTGQLTAALAGARQMGATRGGASFETGKVMRFLEIDGKRYPLKGLTRIDDYEPSLTLQILEQSEQNLEALLGNTEAVGHTAYSEYTLDLTVRVAHYLENICIVTALSNVNTLIVIAIQEALAVESIEFPLEDKNEVVTETRFVGHALDTDPTESPLRIFYPSAAAAS